MLASVYSMSSISGPGVLVVITRYLVQGTDVVIDKRYLFGSVRGHIGMMEVWVELQSRMRWHTCRGVCL